MKPVDSSDTKGVTLVHSEEQIPAAVKKALTFSKKRKIIIEEYVNSDMANLHGDAFVVDGEIAFCMLGDRLFNSLSNPLKPNTERYPGRISDKLLAEVQNEVSEIIQKCGFSFGSINIEPRVDRQRKIYIKEIGPRSGGTLTPQTIRYSTGYDMLKATFDYFKNCIAYQKKFGSPSICLYCTETDPAYFRNFILIPDSKGILEKYIFL